MAVKQLSVFIENKKGSLADITKLLCENNINIRALTVADTKDYGILRLIAEDTEKATNVLKAAGHTASVREVSSFSVPDEMGGLSKVLELLDENGINMEYLYSMTRSSDGKAFFIMRVDDNEKTEEVLRRNSIEILND